MPADRIAAAFHHRFGRAAEGVWEAPGRVNLIGDHTDYEEGFALPLALELRATVAAARRHDGLLRISSRELGEAELRLADVGPGRVAGFGAYVAGPAWALAEAGAEIPGLDLLLWSDVPIGAGLSSSAAVGCATALATRDLCGGPPDPMALARVARRAENEVAGVPCGLMDQATSLLARAGHALLLDSRLPSVEPIPLGAELLVIDTGTDRALAAGPYSARRAECRAAARQLGLPALRDADLAAVERLEGVGRRRARHVVTENARVLRVADLLRKGEAAAIGEELTSSHASLRDDFEVSTPELDAAVRAALDAGALGARMTGGGFGGAVVALPPPGEAESIAASLGSGVLRTGGADGARRVN